MSDTSLTLVSATKSFGGWLKRYKHSSSTLNCEMIFAIYLPPQAESGPVPLLWWLSGLTCTDENFMQKAGAQRIAAELGLAVNTVARAYRELEADAVVETRGRHGTFVAAVGDTAHREAADSAGEYARRVRRLGLRHEEALAAVVIALDAAYTEH